MFLHHAKQFISAKPTVNREKPWKLIHQQHFIFAKLGTLRRSELVIDSLYRNKQPTEAHRNEITMDIELLHTHFSLR